MRQYKLFILFIQVVFCVDHVWAGFERTALPAAVVGRGFSGVALASEQNVWLNPAALLNVTSLTSSVFYSPSPFQLPQLTNFGAQIADDIGVAKVSASFTSFGFSLYKETTGSFSIAHSDIQNFSFGATLSVYHLSISRYGTAVKGGVDIGAVYSFTEALMLGVALHNVTRSTFGNDDDIPQVMLAGVSYRVIGTMVVMFDLVKDVRYEPTYRAGAEFQPHEIVTLRTGIQGEPSRLFGGVGIHLSTVTVDYGIATHNDLGLTHSIGVRFT
ncbi:MAG: hypothetical protein AB1600_12375, partial [Bacteroidota bacterium]